MSFNGIFCTILLSPSFIFIGLSYLPVVFGCLLWYFVGGWQSEEESSWFVMMLPVLAIMIFVILQKRELKRFMEQQKLQKNE